MEEGIEKPKSHAWILILAIIIVLALLAGGYWVFYPKDAKEENNTTDKSASSSTQEEEAAANDTSPYNWSTMNEGPYNDKISYATSTDLLHWSDSEKILATHASVPDAIIKDGIIYVYFVDVSQDGKPEQTGLIKSTDGGKTWSERQFVSIKGLGAKAVADPDPYLLADGRIRLFYFDIRENRINKTQGQSENKIYSAISSDGINFTQEDGIRFKYPMIFDPDVIKVGDTWTMYAGTDQNRIISATSSDGLTFAYQGIAAENAGVPNSYHDGSRYLLFTAGIDIFTSSDGIKFTNTANSFNSGGLTADPGVIKLSDGSYLMVYKTSDKQPIK